MKRRILIAFLALTTVCAAAEFVRLPITQAQYDAVSKDCDVAGCARRCLTTNSVSGPGMMVISPATMTNVLRDIGFTNQAQSVKWIRMGWNWATVDADAP